MFSSHGRMLGAAALAAILCSAGAEAASLDSAKESCDEALGELTGSDGCDAYVAAAEAAKDLQEKFNAYTTRALLREFTGDLPGALADAETAFTLMPSDSFAKMRRATLLGENGEYTRAKEAFDKGAADGSATGFEENMAMVEYVTGERSKAVALFQAAAAGYADQDPDMAAIHRFTAAIIESELNGGDLAPIEAQDVSRRKNTMLPLLKRHRLGELSDADLVAQVEKMSGGAARENKCDGYFSVGHRNAVSGDVEAARQAFETAVARCNGATFEYHAAKAWLKQYRT